MHINVVVSIFTQVTSGDKRRLLPKLHNKNQSRSVLSLVFDSVVADFHTVVGLRHHRQW